MSGRGEHAMVDLHHNFVIEFVLWVVWRSAAPVRRPIRAAARDARDLGRYLRAQFEAFVASWARSRRHELVVHIGDWWDVLVQWAAVALLWLLGWCVLSLIAGLVGMNALGAGALLLAASLVGWWVSRVFEAADDMARIFREELPPAVAHVSGGRRG